MKKLKQIHFTGLPNNGLRSINHSTNIFRYACLLALMLFALSSTAQTWTGAVNSDWNTGGNWSSNTPPIFGSFVNIPNTANDPVIDGIFVFVNTITIASSAQLTIESDVGLGELQALQIINAGTLLNNGKITASGTANPALIVNSGTLTNTESGNLFGTTGVIELTPSSNLAVFNTGTFNNSHLLTVKGGGLQAIFNDETGVFNNSGNSSIGTVSSFVDDAVNNHGEFNNTGTLSIQRALGNGIEIVAPGTFDNEGIVNIGTVSVGKQGIYMSGDGAKFNNNGGTLDIDNTGSSGSDGTGIELLSDVKFINDGGIVNIDNTLNAGIKITLSDFENNSNGVINIGQDGGNIGGAGVIAQLSSSFKNNGSTLKIDNTNGVGIDLYTSFNNSNSANVQIGQGAGNIGSHGLRISGSILAHFTNDGGSELLIDNVGDIGIFFGSSSTKLTNKGGAVIRIGENGAIGANNEGAIETTSGNATTILNQDCAEIYLYDFIRLISSASFTNSALLFIDTNFGHTNDGSCINNGIINYKQNNTIPNVTNNDLIIFPASSSSCKFENVLQIGNNNDFTPLTTWYTDEGLTTEAGTYNAGNNSFDNTSLPAGTTTLYFTASGNSCTFDAQIDLTNDVLNPGYKTWTGDGNRTWIGGCNWSPYGIPTSTDDVIIADVSNTPIIYGTHEGFAKSVKVEANSLLTVLSGGTLTVTGAAEHGFENDGTVNLSGTINLSDTQNNGVLNNAGGSFNCNGNLNINNVGQAASGSRNGIENNGTFSVNKVGQIDIFDVKREGVLQAGGTFTNKGEVSIGISGGANNINRNGIYCQATFTNDTGAELNIDNTKRNGVQVVSGGSFYNSGEIIIEEATGSAPYSGIENEDSGTFENLGCGTLTLSNRLWNAGTFNNTGNFIIHTTESHANSGTFTNDGVINYSLASFIPDAINNDLVISPVSGACSISDILDIGGSNNFTPAAIWHADEALTNAAGDYDHANNFFMVTNLAPNNSYTVYFTTTGNGCSFENSIELDLEDDMEAPAVVCLNPTIELGEEGNYTLQGADVIDYANSYDNCGAIMATSISPNAFDCKDPGVYTVAVTAVDLAGNEGNCTATVTIVAPSSLTNGTRTWTGAFSSDWSDDCNWNPISVPTIADDVIIPDVATAPIIGSTVAAVAKSVNVESNGSLTINGGGSLTIDAGGSGNLTNSGIIDNGGTIKIDNASGSGINCNSSMQFTNSGTIEIGLSGGTNNISGSGITIRGTFINNAGASISILQTSSHGINKQEGSFTNEGMINIGLSGSNPNISGAGMFLLEGFNNMTGGIVKIARTGGDGITNGATNGSTASTLTNEGTITIGFNAGNINIGDNGIESTSKIINTGGTINIDRVTAFGILSDDGDSGANAEITNSGTINIGLNGAGGNIGEDGIYNRFGDITNSGTIRVAKTKNAGIDNRNGLFVNSGTIEIGQSGNSTSITNEGILNRSGTGGFRNESGGVIKIDNTGGIGLKNQSTNFKNYATVIIGQIGNIGDDGIENTGTFLNDACDALIHIVSNDIIDNQSNFNNNNGTIIEEASSNSNISTNNDIVLNLNGGTFNITTDNGLLTTTAGSYWTGCTGSDWNTSSNWFNDAVPTATDDVVILAATNAPVIDGTTMAVAKSVDVKSGASLAINNGSSLTIDGSADDGLALSGILTNNGTLQIDNVSGDGIESQAGSSIFNGGIISIGQNSGPSNVGGMGMSVSGPITNEIGGMINVLNVVSNGIRVTDTSLDNFGEIVLMASNISTGLYLSGNGATITNKSGASLAVDGFHIGFNGGNNTNFINEGILTFDNQQGYSIDVLGNVTNTGTVKGNGKFIFNDDYTWDGTVSPGLSPGNFDLNDGDNIVFASTFILEIEVNGTTPVSEHDRVRVINGDISLDGTLDVTLNYTPFDGDRFVFLEADNITGTFANVSPTLPTYWSVDYSVPGEVALAYILTCGTTTWTGAAGTDWNDEGNWSLTIPKYCDDVIIPDVANSPIIDGTTAAEARSVTVETGALLTINSGGSLTLNVDLSDNLGIDNFGTIDNNGTISVDGSTGDGIYNEGIFDNAGIINIGHAQSPTQQGIQIVGTMTNTGTLDVRRGNDNGIQIDAGGELTNVSSGNILLGQNGGAFDDYGLQVAGTFTNDGGTVYIDNAGENGLRSNGGVVSNLNGGAIHIGTTDGNIGYVGLILDDDASFTNDGSTVNINNTGASIAGLGDGIACFGNSLFENKNGGIINIGLNVGSVGHTGIYLWSGIFNNEDADINIDNAGNDGIFTAATFNNKNGSNINIGWVDGNIVGDGIQVGFGGTFNNNACAIAKVADNLNILNNFTNDGYLLLNTAENHTAGNFINNGILEDVQGTFSGGINNKIIVGLSSTADCSNVSPAFTFGGLFDFNILGVFSDENATISAGAYDVGTNTFTPNTPLPQASTTFYVKIEDSVNGCTRIVTWTVNSVGCCPLFVTCYLDSDGDDFGDAAISQEFCQSCGTGYVLDDTDCDDNDEDEFPNQTWYKDTDDDGYFSGIAAVGCERPSGYKTADELINTTDIDCNDNNANVNPNPDCSTTTRTWTGYISTDWDEACNWLPNCVPTANEDVTIPDVANDPIINGSTIASAKSVKVETNAQLAINSGGSLTIDGSSDDGINNKGTVENFGIINIGQNQTITGNGILNEGTFTNGGEITIGETGSIGFSGIYVNPSGIFKNEVGSYLSIDNTSSHAVVLTGGFENDGEITIGSNGAIGGSGFESNLYSGQFLNKATGTISIDQVANHGMNVITGGFTNSGQITIGGNAGIGMDGIRNGTAFNNNACGIIILNDNLNNPFGTFTNNGFLTLNTNETHTAGDFTNNGVIEDVQGTFSGSTNNEIIIAPAASNCNEISPAFQLGATMDFNILGIFTDENATQSAGTYDVNTNTFTPTNIPLGQQSLFVEIEDPANGCTKVVSWAIDFGDEMPPAFDVANLPDLTAECSILENEVSVPTATDACSGSINGVPDISLNFTEQGTFTIVWTYDDGNGNSASQPQIVIIEDVTPPTPFCKTNVSVELGVNGSYTILENDVYDGGTDNCGSVNFAGVSPATVSCSDVNQTVTVTVTVNDGNGNENTCEATVNVEDNSLPQATCLNPTVVLDASGTYILQQADVFDGGSDNCSTVNFLSMSPSSVDCSNTGSPVSVTVTVFDASGNQATCTATVTLEDNELPQPNCLDPTVQLGPNGNFSLSENEVFGGGSDNCGAVSFVNMSTQIVNCNDVGTPVSVTVTAEDSNGNQNTCEAIITVEDNVAPAAVCQNLTVQLDSGGNASITAAQVDNGSSDACGIGTRILDVYGFACENVGTNTVTLTVTDINGNENTCMASVTVEDNISPTANCTTGTIQATLDANAQYTVDPDDLNNGSSDACGIQSLSASPSLLSCQNEGANTVTLTVADENGNTSTCETTIEVASFLTINGVVETDETCLGMGDGSIVVAATSGGGQVGYSIDGGANFQFIGTFTNLTPGTYNIVVKVFGVPAVCEKTATATVGGGGIAETWYKDMDGDSYSDGLSQNSCTQPNGYYLAAGLLATNGDCDDNDPLAFPGQTWHRDTDGDGYTDGTVQAACLRPSGYKAASELASTSDLDCNDGDAAVHPFATEICNGIDDDCDGQIDEGTSGGLTYVGNVAFYTQADVDAFSQCYSVIDGSLTISGAGISDLSNLFNLEDITGNLTIQYTGLSSMAGLESLTGVGGTLLVFFNSSLTTMDGLENLYTVGGSFYMYYNFQLGDCCAIYDLINGGVIGSLVIYFNKVGCNSVAQINSNCAPPLPMIGGDGWPISGTANPELIEAEQITIFPNPAKRSFTVALPINFETGKLNIVDITGRPVMASEIVGGQSDYHFECEHLTTGIYLVQIKSEGRLVQTKRLVIE